MFQREFMVKTSCVKPITVPNYYQIVRDKSLAIALRATTFVVISTGEPVFQIRTKFN